MALRITSPEARPGTRASTDSSFIVSRRATEASLSGRGSEAFLGSGALGAVFIIVLALRVGMETDPVDRKQATD